MFSAFVILHNAGLISVWTVSPILFTGVKKPQNLVLDHYKLDNGLSAGDEIWHVYNATQADENRFLSGGIDPCFQAEVMKGTNKCVSRLARHISHQTALKLPRRESR